MRKLERWGRACLYMPTIIDVIAALSRRNLGPTVPGEYSYIANNSPLLAIRDVLLES